MASERIDAVIADALLEMKRQGIRGKATTPFLLKRIAELTGGESLAANVALIRSNAKLAAEIAQAFCRLQAAGTPGRS